jgi:catechol 2,3-dioxygenase-like lactoylglutathione lyase family enzyme
MQFSTVTIWTHSPQALRDWYVAHLGLEVRNETPRFVMLGERGAGGAAIAFHVGEPLSEPQRVQLHFAVDDVDAVYDRLVRAGVAFEGKPSDKPWGLRTASCRDPGGHGVEFTMPIR